MIVTAWEGGVRIDLDQEEAHELAEFLDQYYEGDDSVEDILSARLDDVLQITRE